MHLIVSSLNFHIPLYTPQLQVPFGWAPAASIDLHSSVLDGLSQTACIHFKTLLLLFMATKTTLPASSSPLTILEPTPWRLVCVLLSMSICASRPHYRFTHPRVHTAVAPRWWHTHFGSWQLQLPYTLLDSWPISYWASHLAYRIVLHKQEWRFYLSIDHQSFLQPHMEIFAIYVRYIPNV